MKLIITLILVLLTTLFSIPNMSQCVKGSGDIITKTLTVDEFSKIKIECSADVILKSGNTQHVEVEGQPNIIDQLTTTVNDGRWEIDFRRSVCFNKGFVIYITIPHLESIMINGSGDVSSNSTFKEDDFDVNINGSGDVNVNIDADKIDVKINGSGDVILNGSSQNLEIEIDGSGDVSAFDLQVNNCEVAVDGSGDSNINVSGSLSVSINGSGDVTYKGNPNRLQVVESGSGDVSRY